jgi:hypothetical protein
MSNIDIYYPEMGQTPNKGAEIIAEFLYSRFKVECLNGIELKEGKGVEYRHINPKNGNKVYYCTKAKVEKLEKKYNVSYSCLLD